MPTPTLGSGVSTSWGVRALNRTYVGVALQGAGGGLGQVAPVGLGTHL